MKKSVLRQLTLLGSLAICGVPVPSKTCVGGDPKILPVKLSQVDASQEIAPEPQGGGTILPLKTYGYKELSDAVWHGGSLSTALLASGTDPNTTSDDGDPILFFVVSHANDQILEDFLAAGANPNRTNRSGDTPLHSAIWRGNQSALELLLQYGADPKGKNRHGVSAIDYARKQQHQDVVTRLQAERPARKKATLVHPPKVIRQPDVVYGSNLFRPPTGGEALIYSADSTQVISGDGGGAIRFFEAASGQIQNVIAAHEGEISELALIPDSPLLVSAAYGSTKFWNMNTSREVMRLRRGGRALSVSPSGRWIFDGYHLWEIESTNPLRLGETGRAYPQAGGKVIFSWSFFTPDNRYLILGCQNGYVWIWNLSNDYARRIGDLKATDMKSLTWRDVSRVADVGAAPLDELLALATSQYTVLTGQPKTLRAFQPVVSTKASEARALVCSPNGQYLAAIGYPSRIDVYDLENDGKRFLYQGHTAGLQAVATSPDGSLLASGGNDQTVRIWDRKTKKELAVIPTKSYVYSLCFSHTGDRLAIGDNASNVYMFDIQAGSLATWRGRGRITGLNFTSNGEELIALGDEIHVLDVKAGEKITSVSAEGAFQGPLAVTPSNLIIGCARSMSAKETYKVPHAWEYGDDVLVPRQDLFSKKMGHRSMILAVAISPDGSLLAASSLGTIRLWNLNEQQPVGVKMCVSHIADLKFSPNGKRLASSGWDGTVRIWDVQSSRQLLVLDADVNRITNLAFFPDGCLVTANGNGTVHLWDVPQHLATHMN